MEALKWFSLPMAKEHLWRWNEQVEDPSLDASNRLGWRVGATFGKPTCLDYYFQNPLAFYLCWQMNDVVFNPKRDLTGKNSDQSCSLPRLTNETTMPDFLSRVCVWKAICLTWGSQNMASHCHRVSPNTTQVKAGHEQRSDGRALGLRALPYGLIAVSSCTHRKMWCWERRINMVELKWFI